MNARHSATNAICHTASGQGGTFEIVVIRHPAIVRIAVIDAGAPTVPALAAPGSLDASGRGLTLVHALAWRWGHHGNWCGRTVWFELECPRHDSLTSGVAQRPRREERS